jgi:hypothetical protein
VLGIALQSTPFAEVYGFLLAFHASLAGLLLFACYKMRRWGYTLEGHGVDNPAMSAPRQSVTLAPRNAAPGAK